MARRVSSLSRPTADPTWRRQPALVSVRVSCSSTTPGRRRFASAYAQPAPLENPDNLVVTPDGSIIFCEDNSEGSGGVNPNEGERLVWLYPTSGQGGDIFTFALNNMDFTASGLGNLHASVGSGPSAPTQKQNEWAGAVFSPDGRWLFANIQTPGVTFAITGPWPWL